MLTDPIADMLSRIRNAQAVKKGEVLVPYSNLKYTLAKILESEGYVGEVTRVTDVFPMVRVALKYKDRKPMIQNIARISKPSQRVYRKANELPRVLADMGIAIVSTSQGLMTNKEARKRKLGGEVLCEIH